MEPMAGIEPATDGLRIHSASCETTTRIRTNASSPNQKAAVLTVRHFRSQNAQSRSFGVALCCTAGMLHGKRTVLPNVAGPAKRVDETVCASKPRFRVRWQFWL